MTAAQVDRIARAIACLGDVAPTGLEMLSIALAGVAAAVEPAVLDPDSGQIVWDGDRARALALALAGEGGGSGDSVASALRSIADAVADLAVADLAGAVREASS